MPGGGRGSGRGSGSGDGGSGGGRGSAAGMAAVGRGNLANGGDAAQQQQGVNLGAEQANLARLMQGGQQIAGLGAGARLRHRYRSRGVAAVV